MQMDNVLKLIALRPWRLLVAEEGATDFICSDQPFVVTWPPARPPDGGDFATWFRDAQVTFPLTRRLAMISTNDLAGAHR